MKISARLMLWIKAVSLSLILIVVVPVLARHGFHPDQLSKIPNPGDPREDVHRRRARS